MVLNLPDDDQPEMPHQDEDEQDKVDGSSQEDEDDEGIDITVKEGHCAGCEQKFGDQDMEAWLGHGVRRACKEV